MKLINKDILIISPEPWGTNFVSKHHYAIELAKRGNNIFFLNPPTKEWASISEYNNLKIINYRPRYRGLKLVPSFLSAWLTKDEFSRIERFCKTTFDIIWNFDSSRFFNLKLFDSKLRISHVVDFSEDKNAKLLNTTTDLRLCTTKYILQRQKKYNPNSFNIGHGYAIAEHIESLVLSNTKNIRVGYLGNLLIKYLNWELIFNLVNKEPDISFFFAGPYTQSNLSRKRQIPKFLTKTMDKKNTFFIGQIKSTQIQSFLTQMDVLLLAYKAENNKEQLANPHKLLEYIASGKIIVSSWTEEYKNKGDVLEMTEDNTQLSTKFIEVINNLNYYNSREKQDNRIAWSEKNTYKKQIDRIEKLIENVR